MCDFSTKAKFVRPAKKGEELVVFKGEDATHRMLVSPKRCDTAVCVSDNTPMRLLNLPAGFRRMYNVEEGALALFTAVEEDRSRPAHDILFFGNGASVKFQDLPVGTQVLLQLAPLQNKAENDVHIEEEELVPVRVSTAF